MSPSLDRLLGRVGLERPEAREAHVVVDVLEDEDLARGAVDRGAGAARHLGHRADVVEVAVGDQDRLDRRAELVERLVERVRLVARIDQQRLRRRPSWRAIQVFSWTGPTVSQRASIRLFFCAPWRLSIRA